MRSDLLTALLLLTVPFFAQRGTIDNVSLAAPETETGRAVALTVRGTNPCGAVEINPGDGHVVTHPITQLPATVTHTYRKPGRYEVRAKGMGNCDGEATATINVTGEALDQPATGTGTPPERRDDRRARRPAEPLSERGRTVTVDPEIDWTHSGVTVREGDIIRLEASGSVVFAPNSPGVGPEGSMPVRAANAPFPNRPAGALIARIGEDGPPVFIGAAEHTLHADRSGVLWLGVNDDHLGDNSGQFRVRVSDRGEAGTSGTPPRTGVGRPGPADRVTQRDVRVRAADQWTDTGILLRAGDVVRLEAFGTVELSQDASDIADPTGSRTRLAPSAPFPQRPAGALIARIAGGEPIFIGARQFEISVMENGTLWLGVNDDHVADNDGQFHVRVSVRPGRR